MSDGNLRRQLRFRDSVAINIGIVVGVGIFRVPSEIAGYIGSANWILAAWAAGGAISFLGVLCYAELSSAFPQTGGTYVYLREAYGPLAGFLFGWVEFSVLRAGSLAGIAYVFTAYLDTFVPLTPAGEKAAALLLIFFFTLLNVRGLRYGTGVQNVLSSWKVINLLAIGLLVFMFASPPGPSSAGKSGLSGVTFAGFMTALVPILWSYGGWNESTFMSGEFRDTRRALPRSLVASILIITGLYVFINAAYLRALSPEEMKGADSIASDIFQHLFGPAGRGLISAAVLVSALGAVNSYIMTGARIPFAMAADSGALAWLGQVNAKFDTPARAFWINAAWAGMLVLWGNFESLLFFTGFAKWLFFALAGGSVFILRARASGAETSFRMFGYPWVPFLFTLISLMLFAVTVIHAPGAAGLGALLVAGGIPLYFLIKKHPGI